MSQRLHIGETKDDLYDCVIVGNDGVKEKLFSEWLMVMKDGSFSEPLKIRIGDKDLFKNISHVISRVFNEIGLNFPDDVWFFYYANHSIEHPTQLELDSWLYSDQKQLDSKTQTS